MATQRTKEDADRQKVGVSLLSVYYNDTTPTVSTQVLHLSHSLYRKRLRTEYQKLQSSKRSKQLSCVRDDLQRNRAYQDSLYGPPTETTPTFATPLPPENCTSLDLPLKATLGEHTPSHTHTPPTPHTHTHNRYVCIQWQDSVYQGVSDSDPGTPPSPSLQYLELHSGKLPSRGRNSPAQHSLYGRGGPGQRRGIYRRTDQEL